jgi:hypothetical protein
MVSGTFNSPYRGSFHLSVALLFTIGRRVVLSLGWWSTRLHTEFHELRATLGTLSKESSRFRIRGCHPLCPTFPDRSPSDAFVTPQGPATPGASPWFGLVPFSLAATYGVSVDFLSCRYLDVSVPCVGFYGLYIHPQMMPSGCPVTSGFPIRRSPDQSVFDHSPEHIAAYHVLHRLSTPRHPPCTLSNLATLMRS